MLAVCQLTVAEFRSTTAHTFPTVFRPGPSPERGQPQRMCLILHRHGQIKVKLKSSFQTPCIIHSAQDALCRCSAMTAYERIERNTYVARLYFIDQSRYFSLCLVLFIGP